MKNLSKVSTPKKVLFIGLGTLALEIVIRRKERTEEASSLSGVSMKIMSNRQQEGDNRFIPKKVLVYCLIVGLSSAILSIFIDGLRLLSMAAFVFASITLWYMFGEKFHKWQERREEKKTTNI